MLELTLFATKSCKALMVFGMKSRGKVFIVLEQYIFECDSLDKTNEKPHA